MAAIGLSEEKGIPENVILVPTEGNGVLVDGILTGVEGSYFYEELSEYVSVAEVCGEWRKSCVKNVERDAKKAEIIISKVEDAVFPLAT